MTSSTSSSRPSPDAWNVTLRRLEDGFLVAQAERGGKQAAGVSYRRVAGLAEPLQFFRIRVDVDDAPELGGEVWLICADAQAAVRDLLAAALPQAELCFVTEERSGFARVTSTNDRRAPVVAAATAVMRYAASWDESPIAIEVGEQRFSTTVGFENKNYRVPVRREHA